MRLGTKPIHSKALAGAARAEASGREEAVIRAVFNQQLLSRFPGVFVGRPLPIRLGDGKWTWLLDDCARLGVGQSLTLRCDEKFARNCRAMLGNSKRTHWSKWSVRSAGGNQWLITKTGTWHPVSQSEPSAANYVVFDRRFRWKVRKLAEQLNRGRLDVSNDGDLAALALAAPLVDSSLAWHPDKIASALEIDPAKVEMFYSRLIEQGALKDGRLQVDADMSKIVEDENEWHLWQVEFALITLCMTGEIRRIDNEYART
jgi:hypothetical protein